VDNKWWFKDGKPTSRFAIEIKAMTDGFGDLFKIPKQSILDGNPYWVGNINVNIEEVPDARRNTKIIIKYPSYYPSRGAIPKLDSHAFSYADDGRVTPHVYSDGNPCLYNPSNGATYGWNPSRSTATTIAAWTIDWIYAWWHWNLKGEWLGYEHDVPGMGYGQRRQLGALEHNDNSRSILH
jgi:hypothetical protein